MTDIYILFLPGMHTYDFKYSVNCYRISGFSGSELDSLRHSRINFILYVFISYVYYIHILFIINIYLIYIHIYIFVSYK